jgi:hypothetical protein
MGDSGAAGEVVGDAGRSAVGPSSGQSSSIVGSTDGCPWNGASAESIDVRGVETVFCVYIVTSVRWVEVESWRDY